MAHLFFMDLAYVAGPDLVEKHHADHREYLANNYDAGACPASGRKEPGPGDVILAQRERGCIEEIVATDPFAIHGVADYCVTEFLPSMTALVLKDFREA